MHQISYKGKGDSRIDLKWRLFFLNESFSLYINSISILNKKPFDLRAPACKRNPDSFDYLIDYDFSSIDDIGNWKEATRQ